MVETCRLLGYILETVVSVRQLHASPPRGIFPWVVGDEDGKFTEAHTAQVLCKRGQNGVQGEREI
jgi:hypothetical protein